MGVWGEGIFSDDTACDVKEEYRDLLGDGHPGQEATDTLMERWGPELEDADVGPVFWLTLAATQWQYGRLEARVKERALQAIDSGWDLARWQDDPKSQRKRQGALTKLRQRLESPQPPEKKIKPVFKSTCDWEVGEVLAYRLLSGRWILFRVIGHDQDRGGVSPICEFLDWVGNQVPPPEEVANLPLMGGERRSRKELKDTGISGDALEQLNRLYAPEDQLTWADLQNPKPQFNLLQAQKKELPRDRLVRLGVKSRNLRKPRLPYGAILWRDLDARIKETFGLE